MLTPHHREDSELGKIRFAAENLFDPLEFFRGETVFRHQLRRNDRSGGRFGAGHRPRTLTDEERASTRLRTQLADCEVCCGGSSSPLSADGRTRPVASSIKVDRALRRSMLKIMSAKPSSFSIAPESVRGRSTL